MTRTESIAELAEAISEDHFGQRGIEPISLIERLSITWSFGSYNDAFDGLIEYFDDAFHIYLNRDRLNSIDAPRARFTAAHELGHYYIDEHRNSLIHTRSAHPSFVEVQSDLEVEKQADWFASNFLLPRKRFMKQAKKQPAVAATVFELANHFGTSAESTALRYVRTSERCLSAMYWTNARRKWCWGSDSAQALTKNAAITAIDKIPSGSNTVQIIQGPVDPRGDDVRGSTLSSWFHGIRPGSYSDHICKESVIRLGRFGFLTLLDIESSA